MQPYINPNYFNFAPYTPQGYNLPPANFNGLNGPNSQPQTAKIINDFAEITVGDIPTNGAPGYFIKSDHSEIQSRRWSEDGRIITCRFLPDAAEPQENPFEKIMKRLDEIEAALKEETAKE